MNKRSKGIRGIFTLFAVISIWLFGNTVIYADLHGSVDIVSVTQKSSSVQPGDRISLEVTVEASGFDGDNPTADSDGIYFSDVTVTGSGIDTSKSEIYFDVSEGGGAVTNNTTEYTLSVSGIVYNGGSKDIKVTVLLGDDYQGNTIASSSEYDYTISAKTSEEFEDVLSVEKQDNILVKSGQTQNAEVKITNKSNFTVNQTNVTLALDSKVEGITIKTSEDKVSSIKSKETKKASFSIKVDDDVEAGLYPATVTVGGNSYSVNIQVDSNIVPSALEISTSGDKIYTPGTAQNISFELFNAGDRDAKNIRFEVVNTENVSIVEDSNVRRLDIIASKHTQHISMKMRINSSYKGESVAVPIKISYLSSTGEKEEDTQYVYLYTSGSSAASEVTISNVISPTTTYGVDENFTVKFNVSSKATAEDLEVSVEGDEGIVPKSQNLFFLDKLEAGTTKQYSVTFAATRKAVSSSHPIKISITYGGGEKPITVNQYGSVNITNPELDEEDEEGKLKGKPKVIIGEYVITPTIVQAGENFQIELGFLNTSSEHSVHNLKANITVAPTKDEETKGNVFTPVGGSNTMFIPNLAPGGTSTKVLTMYTIPSALAKTHEITLEMEYEDEDGNEIETSENIGIPVEQVTSIDVGDVYIDMAQLGMETYFSASLYNRGRADVSNMMVYIEGDGFTVADNKYFVGTFEVGESESYEPIITPNEVGLLSGELVVEYEDTSGKPQVIREPFEFEVEDMSMMDEGMMMEDPEMMMGMEEEAPADNKVPLYIGIGVGVLIAIVIVVIVLKKRKAKKEEMMLDEED